MHLASLAIVIGIIKTGSICQDRRGAGNGVVKHALHAVAVMRVASCTQQISRDLEMAIGSTRRFKTGVRGPETGIQQPFAGFDEGLIRPPASCGIALVFDHP